MRQSQLFTKTLRETPKDEKSINARFLIRAGFIYKEMSGAYTFLPLGIRVLEKIENIIKEEMDDICGQRILMTVLQPKHLWEETGRWSQEIGEVMYKCKEDDKEVGLGPTHEEMLTDIIRHYVKSYEDLPLFVYQIQTKFRKEPRAKSGLLRGREFQMKDLYSFHSSPEDFKKYYQKAARTYSKIFKRCGLEAIMTEASGEGFTKEYTHEFQALSQGGEDTIIFCPKKDFSQNKEIAKLKAGDKCPRCKNILREGKSIEVGNIFPLGTKYSQSMSAFFIDKDGKKKPIIMGCYGIGISRVMGAIAEIHNDKDGIIWPKETSPFAVHLISIPSPAGSRVKVKKRISFSSPENTKSVKKAAEKLYQDLQEAGIEVLYDDREEKTAGEKFADADLIGIPIRLVISERTIKQNCAELKKRNEEKTKLVKLDLVKSHVKQNSVAYLRRHSH